MSISVAQPGLTIPISQYLFEGDILLTPLQVREILHTLLDPLRRRKRALRFRKPLAAARSKRKIYGNANARWPRAPIAYRFHDSLGLLPDTTTRSWEYGSCRQIRNPHFRCYINTKHPPGDRLLARPHLSDFRAPGYAVWGPCRILSRPWVRLLLFWNSTVE